MSCESPAPRHGRILAIDYGTVRLGFAISDPNQEFASPYANYTRVSTQKDLEYICRILHEEQIVMVVVGLPVHLDGQESKKSGEARRFGRWIARETQLPLAYHDERFTSVEAESHLASAKMTRKRRKARRDMLAAQLLLSAYLESDRQTTSESPQAIDDK